MFLKLVEVLTLFVALLAVSLWLLNLAIRALRRSRGGLPARGLPKGIRLVRADAADLKDPAAVEARARPLLDLGFADAGTYVIEPLSLAVRFVVKPLDAVYAAVYDRHPVAGSWVDLVTLYEDGGSITMNDLARASSLDERPGHAKVRVAGARSDELYRKLLAERPAGPTRKLTAADVPARFEKAYTDEMAWRDARGGPTEDEIRRIAAASGKTLTDEQVKRAREILAQQAEKRRG